MSKELKVYSGIDQLPNGHASKNFTEGCLVLEGGAWRGIYTQDVVDALMEEDINLSCTIGVSAGALCGFGYTAGQIGRAARLNLKYRHDPRYMGKEAFESDQGITGFQFVFEGMEEEEPFDYESFNDPARRFVAVTTDVETGQTVYFEKGKTEDIFRAIKASATVPYVSLPVEIEGRKYLDGGISEHIPLRWALDEDYEKIIVVKTRDRSYRRKDQKPSRIVRMMYYKYPALQKDFYEDTPRYNIEMDFVDSLERMGRIYVIAPEEPIEILRFEGDMEKLGELYWRGYHETKAQMNRIKEYLKKSLISR